MSQLIYIQHDQVQIHEHYMFYFDIPNQHKLEPGLQFMLIGDIKIEHVVFVYLHLVVLNIDQLTHLITLT